MNGKELKWYEFSQNNSGGSFDVDDKVTHRVFIEAGSEHEATEKALELGIYFQGVDDGIDCPCCGDRWYSGSEVTFPIKWKGELLEDMDEYAELLVHDYGWISNDQGPTSQPDTRMYHIDGKVTEWYYKRVDGGKIVWKEEK